MWNFKHKYLVSQILGLNEGTSNTDYHVFGNCKIYQEQIFIEHLQLLVSTVPYAIFPLMHFYIHGELFLFQYCKEHKNTLNFLLLLKKINSHIRVTQLKEQVHGLYILTHSICIFLFTPLLYSIWTSGRILRCFIFQAISSFPNDVFSFLRNRQ